MNDHRLRQADPYRGRDLHGADVDLLEEILADQAAPTRLRETRRHRSLGRRLAVSVAAAAAVTAAVGVPALIAERDTAAPLEAGPSSTPSQVTPSRVTPIRYAAAAVRVAEENPRILVAAPGWKVRTVEGFDPHNGETTFQLGPDRWRETPVYGDGGSLAGTSRTNAAPHFEVTWYPRDQYESYRADRATVGGLQHVTVLGRRAQMVSYSATDHAVMLPPQGEVFIELRGRLGNEAEFKRFLAEDVEQVGVGTWLAAMPASVVTSGSAETAAAAVLADIAVPPGFDRVAVARGLALDSYQFGAKVTGEVACGWIAEWDRARRAGDEAAARRAADALAGSRNWKVLAEMDAEGDYPEVIWGYADQVSAGRFPTGYRQGLGC